MTIRFERDLFHSSQQLPERRISGKIHSHRQRVHKEANQVFSLSARAIRYGRAYNNVLLIRVAVQQRLKSSQQRHKERCSLATAQFIDGIAQSSWQISGILRSVG